VTTPNYVIESGETLNFFDTFSPNNLELLEIDSFEDYKKFFHQQRTLHSLIKHTHTKHTKHTKHTSHELFIIMFISL
jgi:hypothetical protein